MGSGSVRQVSRNFKHDHLNQQFYAPFLSNHRFPPPLPSTMIPFPHLPPNVDGAWSPAILDAYEVLQESFRRASQLQQQEDVAEPLQLKLACQDLDSQSRLLNAMEREDVPEDWVHEAALALALQREALHRMINASTSNSDR